MKNPLIKNNKTWLMGDIQHRTSHYNRILCAKSTYSNESPKRQSILNHINCKYRTNTQAEKRRGNQKLVKSLLEINRKFSSYGKEQYREPKSLKNQFVLKEQNNKIMDSNLELYRKIVNATSDIRCKKRWRSRKKVLKNRGKILNNKREAYLNLDQQFYSTYQKLRHKKQPSILKVESTFGESFRKETLRSIRREKFFTQPVQVDGEENYQL